MTKKGPSTLQRARRLLRHWGRRLFAPFVSLQGSKNRVDTIQILFWLIVSGNGRKWSETVATISCRFKSMQDNGLGRITRKSPENHEKITKSAHPECLVQGVCQHIRRIQWHDRFGAVKGAFIWSPA